MNKSYTDNKAQLSWPAWQNRYWLKIIIGKNRYRYEDKSGIGMLFTLQNLYRYRQGYKYRNQLELS